MAKLFEIYAELGLDAGKFERGVQKAGKQGKGLADSLRSGLGGAASTMGKGFSAVTVMLGDLMASAVKTGARYVKDFVGIGLEYNNVMETYVTNFRTMLGGSSEAAAQLTKDLETMAASTPFAMSDLADATQVLLSFGQDSSTVLDTLSDLGDIAMGDANRLDSLTLAFAQVASTGKLTGQDLMQMINAGFNPLQTIVDKTGVSMGDLKEFMSTGKASAQLKKDMKAAQKEVAQMGDSASDGAKMLAMMAEQGVISAEMLGMIFDMETSPGGRYHNAMKNASETFTGMLSTLQDDSAALLGKVFQPMSDWLKDELLPGAQKFIANVTKGFDVGGLAGAWSAASGTIMQYVGQLGGYALDVGSDLLANILSGLTGDEVTSEEIKTFFSNLWTNATTSVTNFVTEAGSVLSKIWTGIVGDEENQSLIVNTLSGLWTDAKAAVESLVSIAGSLWTDINNAFAESGITPESVGKTIGGVFTAGVTAAGEVVSTAKTFFADVAEALGDPDATLMDKVAGIFKAGSTAMADLISAGSTFISDLYGAISGDTEGAAKLEAYLQGLFETPESRVANAAKRKIAQIPTTEHGLIYSNEYEFERELEQRARNLVHTGVLGESQYDAYMAYLGANAPEGNDAYYKYGQWINDRWLKSMGHAAETNPLFMSEAEGGLGWDKGVGWEGVKYRGAAEAEAESAAVLKDLSAAVESLIDGIAEFGEAAADAVADAASSAASAINGAKVELDGVTVGRVILPTIIQGVSAGIARAGRTAAKTLA